MAIADPPPLTMRRGILLGTGPLGTGRYCVAALLVIVLFGCRDATDTRQQQPISWAGAPATIEAMVDNYLHDRNVQSDLTPDTRVFDPEFYAPPTPYFIYRGNDDAMTVALAARVPTSQPPIDVFLTDLYWFQNFETEWLENLEGQLYPSSTTATADDESPLNLLHPDLLQACRLNGQLYAAPLSIRGNCLYYRADLIEKPPETWPQLVEMALDVLAAQPPDSKLKHGLTLHWQELYADVYPVMWGYGGGPPQCLDAKGNLDVQLTSPENLAALKMLHHVIHVAKLTEKVSDMSDRELGPERELYREFVEGRTLFLIDLTNRAALIDSALRAADDAGQPAPFDVESMGLAPIPHGPDHDQFYSTNSSLGWVLASHPRSAHSLNFVRQMVTPRAQLHFFERHAEVPIFKEESLHALPEWSATSARLHGYHRRLMELVHGTHERSDVVLRDRPARKEVNRLVQEALVNVLGGASNDMMDMDELSEEKAMGFLIEADQEIVDFLRRLRTLGINCDCPPAAIPATSTP